jgi:spore maturation protein CgeB
MKQRLHIALFCHSLVSDWNHGNAHFLRGLMRELVRLGHRVRCYEELSSWSLANLMRCEGERGIEAVDLFHHSYPELDVRFYKSSEPGLARFLRNELRDVHVVLLHEWNQPHLVNSVLSLKQKFGFVALLHDTHHRAYTAAREILKFDLHRLDGVLAFGEALRRIYADGFGVARAWTFHEAADAGHFLPLSCRKEIDLVWVGNWGDEERSRELQEFLIEPAAQLHGSVVLHGVRYPAHALEILKKANIDYRGYLPNLRTPEVFARSMLTVHVPRRQYANGLAGIPTIRVFEALACGIPLLCSPWKDEERLFRPGEDYLVVNDGREMQGEIHRLLHDESARRQMAENALQTIRRSHTCAHRARQLIEILEEISA